MGMSQPDARHERSDVHEAALETIRRLSAAAQRGMTINAEDAAARIGIAQIALLAAKASVGVCATDGSDLHFVGRPGGLFVCCGGSPQHCWQV